MSSSDPHISSILGVDLAHTGLYCRYARGCRERWVPKDMDSPSHLAAAIAGRNLHEKEVHSYDHEELDTAAWSFHQSTTFRGRSRLGRRNNRLEFGANTFEP